MAHDITLPARRASLKALKADAAVTALVPASAIHPGTVPAGEWTRFIRWGVPLTRPLRGSCVDGGLIDLTYHAFAKPRTEGGVVVETAEDHAARIGAAIASCLDRARLDLDGGRSIKIMWRSSQLIHDGDEPDAWHSIQTFTGRALA